MVTAVILVLDRLLLPSIQWYLRRRVNRVIEEINARLDIEIRPFQFTRKQALVDQLVFDDKVIKAIKDYAQEHNTPIELARSKAQKYAREIAPAFNAFVYFRVGYWLARKVGRLIYRVRVGFYDDEELKNIPPGSSVVFVMNHRSNMDYILVSFLVAEKTALSYAVGEWARIWPLQSLIKAMGAFFVRRNSGNALYRRVLERYINLATRAGVCQAVFLEGGLTRDGRTAAAKLGFLDYMLRDYHPDIDCDVVFVPVGINYDRVIEDKSLVRSLERGVEKRSTGFVLKAVLQFFFKTMLMKRKARWRRFGYASVNFGKPVSVREYCSSLSIDFSQMDQDKRHAAITELSGELMADIDRIVPVLPIALMSEIILAGNSNWQTKLALKAQAVRRIAELDSLGAPINISEGACERVLEAALLMLEGRGFLSQEEGLYQANPDTLNLLQYYANSIVSWRTQ